MADISSNRTKKEKSLIEIFHIVYKRKNIILSFAFLFLILAFLYNQFSIPVFESSALIKKESDKSGGRNELSELVRLETGDRIDTEIELIQTEDVLSRVIDELNLRVELKEIIDPIGNSYKLNNVFIDFPDSGNSYAKQIGFSLPIFKNVKLKNKKTEKELYIEKKSEKVFELKDIEENRSFLISKTSQVNHRDTLNDLYNTNTIDSTKKLYENPKGSIFNTDFAQFQFSWNDAPIGSKIYFNFNNYYEFLKKFKKSIYITGVGITNMFVLNPPLH